MLPHTNPQPIPPADASHQQNKSVAQGRLKPTIRGGFVVIGLSVTSNRLTLKNDRPYEHASREAAQAEARRLAARHGREFAVFQEVAAERPPAGDATVSNAGSLVP